MNSISRAVRAIRTAKSVVIALHKKPDGDAICSGLALWFMLNKTKKKCVVVSGDDIPESYKKLKECRHIRPPGSVKGDFELGILVECSSFSRAGSAESILKKAKTTINIDHHIDSKEYADINVVNPRAGAVAEIVYEMLTKMKTKIDERISTLLMTAIFADTGSFQFSNTSARTFLIAGKLASGGASADNIAEFLYSNRSMGNLWLLKRALSSLEIVCGGRAGCVTLSSEDFKSAGAIEEDTDDIVNLPLKYKGIETVVLLKEFKKGQIKVSFRSKRGSIDVREIAAKFGGGGHIQAAGAEIEGGLAEVKRKILTEIRRAYGKKQY